MSIILMLPQIIEESKREYQEIKKADFNLTEIYGEKAACLFGQDGNFFVNGDNLSFMKAYLEGQGKKIQMIYIDPPFFSKAKYGMEVKLALGAGKTEKIRQVAYSDTWDRGLYEYLKMLAIRFYMMKDMLAEDGCLWVHLDWHVVHYVKILLDEIFGSDNFVNEVIWQYKSGGSSKKHFSRKHDTLLFYAKSKGYYFKAVQEKSYNRGFKPYRFKGVKEYRDEVGWYTMVNMKDVWQIDMVGRTSKERTGYATQKPEALLSRILESCTREGDLVADYFGGSGTLAVAAAKMGRRFIHCDIGELAIANAKKRFAKQGIPFAFYQQVDGDLWQEKGHRFDSDLLQENGNVADEAKGSDINSGTTEDIVEVKAVLSNIETSDKKMLEIEILSYNIDLNSEKIKGLQLLDEKTKKVLTDIRKNSNLSFIDYWSIDYNYDGKVYRPEEFIYNENGEINTITRKFGNSFENIAINVVDVFGGSSIIQVDVIKGGF